jgi:hypothetical protein
MEILNIFYVLIYSKLIIFMWGKKGPSASRKRRRKGALKIACFRLVEIYCLPASDMVFTSAHIQPCTVFQNCHLVI